MRSAGGSWALVLSRLNFSMRSTVCCQPKNRAKRAKEEKAERSGSRSPQWKPLTVALKQICGNVLHHWKPLCLQLEIGQSYLPSAGCRREKMDRHTTEPMRVANIAYNFDMEFACIVVKSLQEMRSINRSSGGRVGSPIHSIDWTLRAC